MSFEMKPKVCVIQDGARGHYNVPISLQRAGILNRVYTDWYTRPGSVESLLTKLVKLIHSGHGRRMAERYSAELDPSLVRTKPLLMIRQALSKKRLTNEVKFFEEQSERFSHWVVTQGFAGSNILFGFVRNLHPTLCQAARTHGLGVVSEQMIAPYVIEHQEALLQAERYPGWSEETPSPDEKGLALFEKRTWDLSDRITCASDYVRDGLIDQNVPESKVAMIAPRVDCSTFSIVDRRKRSQPLVIGFIGKIGLRKGTPYFLKVAERCKSMNVQFVMVGPIFMNQELLRKHSGDVHFAGPVSRGEVVKWLEKFDLFLFPTTCEGSAGVVNEAMSTALPVITSPNCGSLIRDGVEGFITAYDDIDAMVDRVAKLVEDEELRHQLGLAARVRCEENSIGRYGSRLGAVFHDILNADVLV